MTLQGALRPSALDCGPSLLRFQTSCTEQLLLFLSLQQTDGHWRITQSQTVLTNLIIVTHIPLILFQWRTLTNTFHDALHEHSWLLYEPKYFQVSEEQTVWNKWTPYFIKCFIFPHKAIVVCPPSKSCLLFLKTPRKTVIFVTSAKYIYIFIYLL